MIRKLHSGSSVFHIQNKNDDNVISEVILRQARKSGKLNLSDKHLVSWPEEILKLGIVHSETDEIDLDAKSDDNNHKWWELEPLKYLDMSSNCLKEIPAGINKLESLMTLILHQNMLHSLPPELGQLVHLVKLDLAYNKIEEFPVELSNLKELRSLNLSNNSLKTFPVSVYDLVMLNSLDFSKNMIESMEPGIGFLTRLITLNLSHNKLSSIPADITNCRGLKSLYLSDNQIVSEGLPEFIDMHNIEVIQLHFNQITALPKLRGCSDLKEIHLGFNKIETLIPEDEDQEITIEELSTLSHLQIINLGNNMLKKLPKELSCLQNLVRLDLSNNNLTELPPTLSLLPHLENVLVDGNSLRTIRRDILCGGTTRLLSYLKQLLPAEELEKNLSAHFPCTAEKDFPDRFTMRCSKAVNLSSKNLCNVPDTVFEEAQTVPCNIVDLSKNKLHQVPQGVWLLSATLNDLNLSHNQLKQIPKEIGTCLNLRYLNVTSNQLDTLPLEFSSCTRMRELNISFNRFQQIPPSVYDLQGLEILAMSDNKIVNIDAEKLLRLKVLTHLNLNNNNLSSVPPVLGKMTQLRTLGLDGNGLRALRPATIAKGTEAVLAWLRDKIV